MARVFVYLFQFLIYTLLMWMGFHYSEMDLPTPIEAPWLWLMLVAAPLIPWHWGNYGGEGDFWLGGDLGDFGDGGD